MMVGISAAELVCAASDIVLFAFGVLMVIW
jgi:hypothetical protein